ncbi:MAG TPA: DUF1080 domain-containing protein [Planctomycetota bacterium]|nr:DUF1080 domain-containing protein [Planctomycetota bacterium]
MKSLSLFLLLYIVLLPGALRAGEAKPNELSEDEKKAGWRLLFDGVSTKGWHAIGKKEFPSKGWSVQDGTLYHKPKGGGGDIVTDEKYENYELELEFKLAPGTNSGLKYRVEDSGGSAFGPEFQISDDTKNADTSNPKHACGSLYDMIVPKNKTMKPVGEWNTAKLVVNGNHCEHWLNGAKVVEYEFFSDEWKKLYAASKYAKNPKYAATAKNHLCLQDHGDEVWYRNIKIRELPAK